MKKAQGFSLLEVLISWVILSTVLLGLADVLTVDLKKTKTVYERTLKAIHVKETTVSRF